MATQHRHPSHPHLSRWQWLMALGFVLLVVTSITYLVLRAAPATEAQAVEDWRAQLRAMADDREAGIERFVSDFLSDARTLGRYPTAGYLLSGRAGPPYPFDPREGGEAHLEELLESFLAEHEYRAAIVYDTALTAVVGSAGARVTGTAQHRSPLARLALSEGDAVVTLLSGPTPRLLAAAPVQDEEAGVVGAVVLETDPEDFLFPLLRQQPTPSRTGEALLVERDGDELVFLSPFRKAGYPEGGLRIPVDSGTAAVAALAGEEAVRRYRDDQGDAILAATRRIDGTDWGLVVKVDESEAMADYRRALGRIVAGIVGLLVGALGVAFGMWRWQQTRLSSALFREQARFAALLDHASDPIFFVDPDLSILEANRRAEEFYGYGRDELLGADVRMFRPEEHRDETKDVRDRALREGGTLVETEHQLASGERVPVEISTRTAELEGRPVMISIVRDIRERKEAEEALRKTEERYRTIVENSPDVVARFGADLRCQYVSPGHADRSPFSGSDPVGRRHGELGLPAATAAQLDDALREVFEAGAQRALEVVVHGADRERFFDWRFAPERDAEGRVVTAVAIIRETTEQHALETRLRQSQKMEAVGRLAGGVAHDFNNVLTSIQGHAELALDALEPGDPLGRDLEEIVRSAHRAASLTRQLLAFSRRQILTPRIVDLGRVVTSMESMLRRLIGEHIDLVVDVRADAPTIRADPTQLEQVLLNLAVNARDAMPGGGRLSIEVEQGHTRGPGISREPEVRLVVSDTGEGMEAETLDHIFEPFYTTKEAGKGTGLGLATVYGIVEQSGGRVRVESESGVGTRFELYFPAVQHPPAEPAPKEEGEPSDAPRDETILLVEDEDGVRALARRVLERQGYTVLTAGTGEQALAMAASASEPLDLLLTDMVMPGMDGRELARRLREEQPGCRVLLMSGYTDDVVVRRRLLEPGTGFMEKPFSPEQLAGAVARMLNDVEPRSAS